jgi:hypothetical protein
LRDQNHLELMYRPDLGLLAAILFT